MTGSKEKETEPAEPEKRSVSSDYTKDSEAEAPDPAGLDVGSDTDPDSAENSARADYELIKDGMTATNATWFIEKHPDSSYATLARATLAKHRGVGGRLRRYLAAFAVIVPVVGSMVAILDADFLEPLWAWLAGETDRPEIEEADLPPSETVERPPEVAVEERDPPTLVTDPTYLSDFEAFLDEAGVTRFGAGELLVMGGSNNTVGGPCFGVNSLPPRELWSNILPTARVLEALEIRLDAEIEITNVFRSPTYNACIGGASNSTHQRFLAIDFKVAGVPAPEAADALAGLRAEGWFRGGIGRYDSFVHLDTRGINSTWPASFEAQIEGGG